MKRLILVTFFYALSAACAIHLFLTESVTSAAFMLLTYYIATETSNEEGKK